MAKKFKAQRPLEIFISYDTADPDWSFAGERWRYAGEYNEKVPLEVLDISVQLIDANGIERVVDVPDPPFEAHLGGDTFTFVLPTDIDVDRLKGVWFRVVPRSRARTVKR